MYKRKLTVAAVIVLAAASIALVNYGCETIEDATEPGASCELHGIPLQQELVPIVYGKPRIDLDESEARQKLFPHARTSCGGGCMVKDARRARVSYCPECRKAEAKWRATPRQPRREELPVIPHLPPPPGTPRIEASSPGKSPCRC